MTTADELKVEYEIIFRDASRDAIGREICERPAMTSEVQREIAEKVRDACESVRARKGHDIVLKLTCDPLLKANFCFNPLNLTADAQKLCTLLSAIASTSVTKYAPIPPHPDRLPDHVRVIPPSLRGPAPTKIPMPPSFGTGNGNGDDEPPKLPPAA